MKRALYGVRSEWCLLGRCCVVLSLPSETQHQTGIRHHACRDAHNSTRCTVAAGAQWLPVMLGTCMWALSRARLTVRSGEREMWREVGLVRRCRSALHNSQPAQCGRLAARPSNSPPHSTKAKSVSGVQFTPLVVAS